MNKNYMSQQLNTRMHFKSLLLLTLLAGSASAQQNTMPPIAFEIPTIPALEVPSIGASSSSGLDVDAVPSLDATPSTSYQFVEASDESSRSTWTLRQHATWLLGLKPRQQTHNVVELSLPNVPQVDILSQVELQPSSPALPKLPDMPEGNVVLVQHSELVASPVAPTLTPAADVITVAGQTTGDAAPVAHAHQPVPQSLNLRPIMAGPAPALPLEQLSGESLLQVDVSGVDPSRVVGNSTAPESLIDSFDFRPPTGFSMRDSDTASLAASPSRAKPVSIHEGFTPRVSSANQAAQLDNPSADHPNDRLTVSLPGASQFSMSDKSTPATGGPVLNRLSDKEPVHEKLGDKDEPVQQKAAAKQTSPSSSVEKSFSDRDSLLASVPVEVSPKSDKTSRSGKPEVLTPPSRLAKDSPLALPLSSATSIASTGIDAALPARNPEVTEGKLVESKPQPISDTTTANKSPLAAQSVESLIDGLVPPPSLLATESPTPAKTLAATTLATTPTAAPAVVKVEAPKPAEKLSLSDTNPIALKRPVVKAANVAIPETAGPESSVVPSSHEMDDAGQQLAQYAKMAAKMQQAIKQKFPNCRVKITCNEDGLLAEGHVANNTEASKVLTYVRRTSLCPVADRITTSQ